MGKNPSKRIQGIQFAGAAALDARGCGYVQTPRRLEIRKKPVEAVSVYEKKRFYRYGAIHKKHCYKNLFLSRSERIEREGV